MKQFISLIAIFAILSMSGAPALAKVPALPPGIPAGGVNPAPGDYDFEEVWSEPDHGLNGAHFRKWPPPPKGSGSGGLWLPGEDPENEPPWGMDQKKDLEGNSWHTGGDTPPSDILIFKPTDPPSEDYIYEFYRWNPDTESYSIKSWGTAKKN